MKYALAVDIGGSKMEIAVIDQFGQIRGETTKYRVPFDDQGIADPVGLLDLMEPHVTAAQESTIRLEGIGLSVCGNIDIETGEAVLVANLHWHNLPFGPMVEQRFGLPVFSATDVRMAVIGEALWGAAKGVRHFAWATIGTGYGAYLFLDGKLYGGEHGFAGNFGHNTYDEINGRLCGCGLRGCFESFVAGPAIARAGQEAVDEGQSQMLADRAKDSPVTTRMVFQAEQAGDPAAKKIIADNIRLVGISLASIVNLLDISLIVLGGGVTKGTPDYISRIEAKTRDYLMTVEARRELRIVPETFSNSVLYGAAANVFIQKGDLAFAVDA
jgi:glucokinase